MPGSMPEQCPMQWISTELQHATCTHPCHSKSGGKMCQPFALQITRARQGYSVFWEHLPLFSHAPTNHRHAFECHARTLANFLWCQRKPTCLSKVMAVTTQKEMFSCDKPCKGNIFFHETTHDATPTFEAMVFLKSGNRAIIRCAMVHGGNSQLGQWNYNSHVSCKFIFLPCLRGFCGPISCCSLILSRVQGWYSRALHESIFILLLFTHKSIARMHMGISGSRTNNYIVACKENSTTRMVQQC